MPILLHKMSVLTLIFACQSQIQVPTRSSDEQSFPPEKEEHRLYTSIAVGTYRDMGTCSHKFLYGSLTLFISGGSRLCAPIRLVPTKFFDIPVYQQPVIMVSRLIRRNFGKRFISAVCRLRVGFRLPYGAARCGDSKMVAVHTISFHELLINEEPSANHWKPY